MRNAERPGRIRPDVHARFVVLVARALARIEAERAALGPRRDAPATFKRRFGFGAGRRGGAKQ
jgi:hypothetical protein